jgi:hypothetical protein
VWWCVSGLCRRADLKESDTQSLRALIQFVRPALVDAFYPAFDEFIKHSPALWTLHYGRTGLGDSFHRSSRELFVSKDSDLL